MNAEWNFAVMVALFCLFLFAVFFARLEKFIFGDCKLQIGYPDCWVFKLDYHLPMLGLFLCLCIGYDFLIWNQFEKWFGVVLFLPSAFVLEDMFYYVDNPYCKPDESEEITSALGFIGRVPILWLAGIAYTIAIAWWRLL
jgi:hypothetical protein